MFYNLIDHHIFFQLSSKKLYILAHIYIYYTVYGNFFNPHKILFFLIIIFLSPVYTLP